MRPTRIRKRAKSIFFVKIAKVETSTQDLCSDTILSFINKQVEPKVQTNGEKVGNPHILQHHMGNSHTV